MFMNKKTNLYKSLLCATSMLFISTNVAAFEAGDIVVRAGVAHVSPDDSSSEVSVNGIAQPGTGVDVEDDTQLGLIATYFVTNNLGVSLLASSPFKHDIKGEDLGVDDIGSIKQLPPTLTLDYFPLKSTNAFQPHIGVGFNYTIFYSEDSSSELGADSLDLTNSFGLALKAGVDYQINDRWGVHATAFWIDIDTEATIQAGANTITVDVDVDPFVYLAGFSYKF